MFNKFILHNLRYCEFVELTLFYTFIVSCQCIDKNPYHWLKDTFEQLRPNMEEEELIKLLHYNHKK